MRNRRRKKRFRVKPRFFVILIILCLVVGAALFFILRNNESSANALAKLEQGNKIMLAAREYITNAELRYDPSYFSGGYPSENLGVCTDVVWEALEGAGITLKDLVDADIERNPKAYVDVHSTPDPNIDFRYVPTLERFLERKTEVLTTDLTNVLAWMPGDIVTFESSHVAIVSNIRNLWGMPYIIQHGKDPAAEEDRIFASDGMKISGHFRWPLIK